MSRVCRGWHDITDILAFYEDFKKSKLIFIALILTLLFFTRFLHINFIFLIKFLKSKSNCLIIEIILFTFNLKQSLKVKIKLIVIVFFFNLTIECVVFWFES